MWIGGFLSNVVDGSSKWASKICKYYYCSLDPTSKLAHNVHLIQLNAGHRHQLAPTQIHPTTEPHRHLLIISKVVSVNLVEKLFDVLSVKELNALVPSDLTTARLRPKLDFSSTILNRWLNVNETRRELHNNTSFVIPGKILLQHSSPSGAAEVGESLQ